MRIKDLKIDQHLPIEKIMKLTESANKFESEIFIVGKNFKVDAKSIMGLLATIKKDLFVSVIAKGEDEEEAIKEFIKLLL